MGKATKPKRTGLLVTHHGVLLLENKAHMIVRMAGGMHSTYGGAFDGKHLTVCDGLLASARRMLVDRRLKMWIQSEKIRHTAGVIAVPMSK